MRINTEQRLYVIEAGKGFTCLGFDYTEKRLRAVAAWMGWTPQDIGNAVPGTEEHYARYQMVMREGEKFARENATRCPVELDPRLDGLLGSRVEVTTPDGEKSRFWVGKSTGWMPCYLEVKTKRSRGGGTVYLPEGATIRKIR